MDVPLRDYMDSRFATRERVETLERMTFRALTAFAAIIILLQVVIGFVR